MKKFLSIITVFLCLITTKVWADVTFDAVSTGTYEGGDPPTEFSWSHTVGAGSNRYIRVCLSYPADAITATDVTFGAQAFTLITSVARAELWELKNPSTGIDTVTVTMTASQNVVGGALSFSDVDQTTPSGTPVTAESGDPIQVPVTVPANGLVSDCMAATGTPTLTAGGGQVSRYNTNNGAQTGAGSTQAASGTLEWSGSGASGVGLIAIPINPATVTATRRPAAPIIF